MQIEIAYHAKDQLGEGPLWSEAEQAIYWVDILAPALQRWQPGSGAYRHWPLPSEIGSFALLPGTGALVALRTGLARLDFATGDLIPVCAPEADLPGLRFNDGKCDPRGRFWVGSMDEQPDGNRASLYCLDLAGQCHRMHSGVGISNGLGWSPDQRTLYYTDSRQHSIYAFDFEPQSGQITNQRLFVQTPAAYVPDGLCVDADGFIWSAMWDGWKVVRFAPDGRVEREIQLPVQRPTSCCFGGPGWQDLFITSARVDLSPQALRSQPQAGMVFVLPAVGQGIPTAHYLGRYPEKS
ncbi:MAG: SMP-30/gluconolactonase/LRE family protein [Anaerolineales bacterium]|nr:SMP-30/gluconolactonase/LRE family protein [Anaerolineales bacterium]